MLLFTLHLNYNFFFLFFSPPHNLPPRTKRFFFCLTQVFKTYDFHFPITLVMIHTVITFLGLFTASCFGLFDRKELPLNPRLVLAGSFVFYNAASLVNLNVNTVSNKSGTSLAESTAPPRTLQVCLVAVVVVYCRHTD